MKKNNEEPQHHPHMVTIAKVTKKEAYLPTVRQRHKKEFKKPKSNETTKWLAEMNDWRMLECPKEKALALSSIVEDTIKGHSGRLSEIRDAISQYDRREYSATVTSGLSTMGLVTLDKNANGGTQSNSSFARMMSGSGLGNASGLGNDSSQDEASYATAINLLRSCCNTLLSKVSKYAILPRIATIGADYHVKDKAKKADRFLRGMFKKLDVRKYTTQALLHSSLYGYGFVKVCITNGKLSIATVNPDEVYVDYHDGHYNKPSTMYQICLSSILTLIANYPEKADELRNIKQASSTSTTTTTYNRANKGANSGDKTSVIVSEVWDLPYGDKAGFHAIFCGDVMLFEEEWNVDYLPILKLEYIPPVTGYYPRGLAHEIGAIQREHDKVTRRIALAQDLISSPKILMRKGSSINPAFYTNEVGTILEVDELDDVRVLTPQSIAGDTFNYVEMLKNSAYETSGVSRLAASAKMPSGVDRASGRALREYHDLETERFASLTLSWEAFHRDLGETILREINRAGLDYVVDSYSRNHPLCRITFDDLNLDVDNLVIQIFGVPDLPSTPAGRIQLAEELTASEYLTPEEASELVNVPDIDSLLELKQAPRKACEKIVSRIMNEREYMPEVDKFLDLEYLQEILILHYNNVIANMDEEDRETERLLTKIKKVLIMADRLTKSLQPPAEAPAAPMMPMEGMMGEMGMPPDPMADPAMLMMGAPPPMMPM